MLKAKKLDTSRCGSMSLGGIGFEAQSQSTVRLTKKSIGLLRMLED